MIEWLRRWFQERAKRRRALSILNTYGCVLYCTCGEILNDSAPDCDVFPNLDHALQSAHDGPPRQVWVCGGEAIYRAVLEGFAGGVGAVDLTLLPEIEPPAADAVVARFPTDLLESRFTLDIEERNGEDPRLLHRTYIPKH